MENLIKKLSMISGGKVLDVGTGRGEFVHLLKAYMKNYEEIIGIDNMDHSIEHCKKQFQEEQIQFIKMDASNIEFDDNEFDTVCISNSIHHLPNQEQILKEMKRVLKPGGQFIIVEMYSDNQTPSQMSHVQLHHFSAEIERVLGAYHEETYTRNRILEIASIINLKNVESIDYKYGQDDPKDPKLIKQLISMCEQLLSRVKEHENYSRFEEKCNELKDWIKTNGFSSATELLIIGEK